jgi:hypothetical protein
MKSIATTLKTALFSVDRLLTDYVSFCLQVYRY